MPNKKISELTAAGALTGAELVEAVQNGQNVKTTTQDIADLGGGGGGSVQSVTGSGVDNTDPNNPIVRTADASNGGTTKLYTTPEGTNTDGAVSQSGINAVRHKSYVATASGTDTYAATVSPAIGAVNSGDRFFIKFTNGNTAAATLNLNILGAIPIKKNGLDALVPNDIKDGQISELVYDGTNFQLQSVATSSPTIFVTDKKRYYHGEWRVNRLISTSTGATSSDTSKDVTDFIAIEGSTEVVIFTTDASLMTVYGWTYDSNFTAISEIRSNALIGTTLSTYTFTTPSNARYIQVYTRNGGTASETDIGWRAVMEIQTTADITYKTPIIPEDYSGTDRQKIQAAIDFARWTSSPVELNGLYLVDAAVIIRSNTKIILNGVVKGAVGIRDNIFRTESAEFAPTTILNRATRNWYIKGNSGGGIAGSDEDWGGYPATGVSGQSWRPIGLLSANSEHFTIEGIRVKSTNMWGIECEQSRFGKIINIDLDQDGRQDNQDGINIRRGCHDILIENIIGITYDDIVAITNITLSSDLDVLGTTIYDPIQTTLDCFNIVIRNISSRQERLFPGFSPPHYGGGILLLCEDGLKIYNVTIDGVTNRKAHLYLGYTSIQYWVTTQCAIGDMVNISLSNIYSPIYIRRPLQNCSFSNVNKYDSTGINLSAAIVDGSVNVLRKYSESNFEWFSSIPAFVPTSIANCGMWFDANDSGSVSTTTSLVDQWNDKSGNARHVTATSSARPLYTSAAGSGLNNKRAVLFDGTTDALRRARVTQFQGLAGITIFSVGGRTAGTPHGGSVVFHGFDANNRTQLLNNYLGDNKVYGQIGVTTDAGGTVDLGQQTLVKSTLIFDGSLSGNSNRLKVRVNGRQLTLTFAGTVGTVTESHASSKFALGTIDIASPFYVAGTMCEVIIYERALTEAEVLQVEAYLEAKWAV